MDFAKWLFTNSGSDDILKGFEHVVSLALKATAAALKCQPVLTKLVRFRTLKFGPSPYRWHREPLTEGEGSVHPYVD